MFIGLRPIFRYKNHLLSVGNEGPAEEEEVVFGLCKLRELSFFPELLPPLPPLPSPIDLCSSLRMFPLLWSCSDLSPPPPEESFGEPEMRCPSCPASGWDMCGGRPPGPPPWWGGGGGGWWGNPSGGIR